MPESRGTNILRWRDINCVVGHSGSIGISLGDGARYGTGHRIVVAAARERGNQVLLRTICTHQSRGNRGLLPRRPSDGMLQSEGIRTDAVGHSTPAVVWIVSVIADHGNIDLIFTCAA